MCTYGQYCKRCEFAHCYHIKCLRQDDDTTPPGGAVDPGKHDDGFLPRGEDVIGVSVTIWPTPNRYSLAEEVSPGAGETHMVDASVTRGKAKKHPDGTVTPGPFKRVWVFHANGRQPVDKNDDRFMRVVLRRAVAQELGIDDARVIIPVDLYD